MDEDDIFECVEVLNVCVLEDIYNSCGFFFFVKPCGFSFFNFSTYL